MLKYLHHILGYSRWPTTFKKSTILHAVVCKFLPERGGTSAPPAYGPAHNMIAILLHTCLQVIGTFCMDLAIKKAKEVGIGWVTCTGQEDSCLYAAFCYIYMYKYCFNLIPCLKTFLFCSFQSLWYSWVLLHESYATRIDSKSACMNRIGWPPFNVSFYRCFRESALPILHLLVYLHDPKRWVWCMHYNILVANQNGHSQACFFLIIVLFNMQLLCTIIISCRSICCNIFFRLL